mmetsp:Transcript_35087/g.52164  ORF Transcript_35087/g.52164 Transcript_35087/m.52164 type:complete len:290 (+) Transcript_35087:222-1091(+)
MRSRSCYLLHNLLDVLNVLHLLLGRNGLSLHLDSSTWWQVVGCQSLAQHNTHVVVCQGSGSGEASSELRSHLLGLQRIGLFLIRRLWLLRHREGQPICRGQTCHPCVHSSRLNNGCNRCCRSWGRCLCYCERRLRKEERRCHGLRRSFRSKSLLLWFVHSYLVVRGIHRSLEPRQSSLVHRSHRRGGIQLHGWLHVRNMGSCHFHSSCQRLRRHQRPAVDRHPRLWAPLNCAVQHDRIVFGFVRHRILFADFVEVRFVIRVNSSLLRNARALHGFAQMRQTPKELRVVV